MTMRKWLFILPLLLASPAWGQSTACTPTLTQAQVLGSFADNNVQGITPRNLRDYVCSSPSSIFTQGPTPPVTASKIGADWVWGSTTDQAALINEGSIWVNNVWVGLGVARSFNSSNATPAQGAGTGPSAGLFINGVQNGTNADVAAIIGDANAKVSGTGTNGGVFGANFIARSNGGSLTNVKLVGTEIDVEPATTDTVASTSAGLVINAFSKTIPVGIQIGGVAGGAWTNAIITPGFGVNGTGAITGTGALTVNTTASGAPQIGLIDSVQGGWLGFSNSSGIFNLATANTAGSFVTDELTLDRSGNLTLLNGGLFALNKVYGGNAAGSTLTLQSTSNGAPSGDSVAIAGTTINLNGASNAKVTVGFNGMFPTADNVTTLGGGSNRWTEVFTYTMLLSPLTIATLPTCNAGSKGLMAFVADTVANAAPTFHGTVTGGGATTVNSPVSCNGTNWQYD